MINRALFVFFVFISDIAMAGMVDIGFDFKSRPPLGGVMYVEKENYSPVSEQVDQANKQFSSPVFVFTPGSDVVFKNSDSMEHNVYADDKRANVKFDVGLMQPESEEIHSANWESASLVRIGCKIHPRMKAYLANVPSDEFVLLDFSDKKKKRSMKFQVGADSAVDIKLILPRFDPVSLRLEQGVIQKVNLMKKGKVKGVVSLALQ